MTQPAKHTPGPWKCNREGLITKDDRYGLHIAQVATVGMGYAIQPNAHLIAAAPAMYEALKETMQVLRSLRDNKEEWYTLVTPELLSAWDKNKQALSQAEGQQL